LLGGNEGRLPLLPCPTPILLVPGDLGVRFGQQGRRTPLRDLTDLCRLVLGGPQQPVEVGAQPVIARD
jgi:hypothetical protein